VEPVRGPGRRRRKRSLPWRPSWGSRNGSSASRPTRFLPDGTIVCLLGGSGGTRLCRVTPAGGYEDLGLSYRSFSPASLVSSGWRLAFIGASPVQPTAVVVFDTETGAEEVVRRSLSKEVGPAIVSVAEPIEFPSTLDGEPVTAHALFYRPNKPRLLGPRRGTATAGGVLARRAHLRHLVGPQPRDPSSGPAAGSASWTSTTAAAPATAGSTGSGSRAGGGSSTSTTPSRRPSSSSNVATPTPPAWRSAAAAPAGTRTLCALTFRDVFSAGASYYGVADAEALARDTHKFESRYLDSLIGPYPEEAALYRQRSPIHFTDRLSCPLIILQGLEDMVVPPSRPS